jgi:hypothetical protein
MAGEPRCPQCGAVVLETWDWCHQCGFDPEGLRPTGSTAAPPPPAPPPPAPPSGPPWSAGPPNWSPSPASPPPPSGTALPRPPGATPTPGGGRSTVPVVAMGAVAAVLVLVVVAAVVLMRPSDPAEVATGAPRSTSTTASAVPTTATASTTTAAGDTATPEGMFAIPDDPGVVIDTPTARTVVSAFWPVHVDGWSRADAATLALVETGPALQTDAVACLAPCSAEFGDLVAEPVVTAPQQTSYPATFAAQIQVPATSTGAGGRAVREVGTFLIVFTRESAEQPWLAALVVTNGSTSPILAPGRPILAVPPAITGSIDPHRLPDQFAAYFQSYRYTGEAPADTPFHDNGGPAEDGTHAWQAHERLLQRGYTDDATYRGAAAEDGYYEFAADAQTLLACSTIRWTSVNTAQEPGGAVDVDEEGMFQAFVPLGRYTRIERDAVRQVCFTVKADCSCLTIVGFLGGPYLARTEPAS